MKRVATLAVGILAALSFSVSAAEPFRITSADIAANHPLTNKQVFQGFGCSGGNISPQLAWQNSPAGTKSFVITVYDPDAPMRADEQWVDVYVGQFVKGGAR